jgi:hypothetical protein
MTGYKGNPGCQRILEEGISPIMQEKSNQREWSTAKLPGANPREKW